jgi:head-tail adaptor
MNVGRLRHQINLLQPAAPTTGAYGTQLPAAGAFTTFASGIWASIEPAKPTEFAFAHSYAATTTHKIRIRYLPGVQPTFQVQFGSRVFSLSGPPLNFEERNIYLDLFCTEVVA